MIGGIGAGLSAGLAVNLWLKPRRILKKLVTALETLEEEEYSATFKDDSIEIITKTKPLEPPEHTDEFSEQNPEQEENSEQSEKSEQTQPEKIDKTVYLLAQEELYSIETDSMFILCVNKYLFHVFPKRCFSEQDKTEKLKNYFSTKGI